MICDATLVFGYAEERRQIDLPLMTEVMGELEATGVLPSTSEAAAAVPLPAVEPVASAAGAAAATLPTTAAPAAAVLPAIPVAAAAASSPARVPRPIDVMHPREEPVGVGGALRSHALESRAAALDARELAIATARAGVG